MNLCIVLLGIGERVLDETERICWEDMASAGSRVAVALWTTQVIHSEIEPISASDVICHVIFSVPKQPSEQWFKWNCS